MVFIGSFFECFLPEHEEMKAGVRMIKRGKSRMWAVVMANSDYVQVY